MNLDSRIKSKLDILSCFDIEKAKEFVGQKGYFANDLYCFSDLETCYYDTLDEVKDGDIPFKDDDCCSWCLFIPESFLNPRVFFKPKPKEKKFRPFKDAKEFFIKTNFEAGDIIRVYYKADEKEYNVMLVGWTNDGLMLGNFYEKFNDLFEWYVLWDGEEKFIPFGVEVEE